jgi:hypothetical protein
VWKSHKKKEALRSARYSLLDECVAGSFSYLEDRMIVLEAKVLSE